MEADMRGRGIRKRIMKFWGKGALGEQGLYFFVFDIVLVWEFGWTVTGVHQVAGSFGLEGQESSQNPGAREPNRLYS
jgi:hypothetical protein